MPREKQTGNKGKRTVEEREIKPAGNGSQSTANLRGIPSKLVHRRSVDTTGTHYYQKVTDTGSFKKTRWTDVSVLRTQRQLQDAKSEIVKLGRLVDELRKQRESDHQGSVSFS